MARLLCCELLVLACFGLKISLATPNLRDGIPHFITRHVRQAKCSRDQFRCLDGSCIDDILVCDGASDCGDGSDETQGSCLKYNIVCPSYTFRCAYGACVEKNAKCNGRQECADNSDELLKECPGVDSTTPNMCKDSEFQCESGQCIDTFSTCDGTTDCNDGSDETITQCINFYCPDFTHRCAYGACVEKVARCNGTVECPDGSDEHPTLCPDATSLPITTERPRATTRKPVTRPTTAPIPSGGCPLPPQPTGGRYKVKSCGTGIRTCAGGPGSPVSVAAHLEVSCDPGYQLKDEGDRSAYCFEGKWIPTQPACQKLCPVLVSNSVDISCKYHGLDVPCNKPSAPTTQALPKCKLNYQFTVPPTYSSLVCRNDGTWDNVLFECKPECGIVNTKDKQKPLILHGQVAKYGEYPWHVGLYYNNASTGGWEQRCAGTLIEPNIVLTAAHCVFNDVTKAAYDAHDLKVAIGKYFRKLELPDQYMQQSNVREIIIPRQFRGQVDSYLFDISLLYLTKPFVLSNFVLPACVDWTQQTFIEPGKLGFVSGWGMTEMNQASSILLAVKLPFVDKVTCLNSVQKQYERLITYDKLCAGYLNGTELGEGDSGGGLTFRHGNFHFVQGIVSLKIQYEHSYTLFTNVSEHIDWIKEKVNNIKLSH